jgi:hypothetical protein
MLNPPHRRETRFLPERAGPNEDAEGSFRGSRLRRFRRPSRRQCSPIAGEAPNTETRLEALIKLEVACRLALESLPKLPAETQEALREPIKNLCEVTGRELERLKPGLLDRGAGSD